MLDDDTNVILPRDRALLEKLSGARTRPDSARRQEAHQLGATTGSATIERMCSTKKSWFRNETDATKAANDCTARYGEQFYFYRCRACDLYHLTTRAPGTMR